MSSKRTPPSASDILQDRLLIEVPLREGYKVLGPVVLFRRLGRGGMGSVYLGRHLRLECEVAVKCLSEDLADDEDFVRRFRAEARSAAQLRHQNIVHVYDVDEASRLHYLVMEYIDGESAGDRLKRKGPLPEQEAIAIALGAAHGLAHAHAKGFVHRDIKPDNILVSRDGEVKVADLGLAKPVGDPVRSMATRSGVGFGTPAYMPPEQAKSAKEAGFPADVYALGATLYSLLTGEKPFTGGDVLEVLQQVLHDPFPDVRAKRPDVSKDVADLIERATRKDAAARPHDGRELARQLALLAHGRDARLADDASGGLGETLPLVSPPPRDVLTRIEISMRSGNGTVAPAGATVAGASVPQTPSVPPARARLPVALWAGAAVAVGAIVLVLALRSSGEETGVPSDPGSSARGEAPPAPPRVNAAMTERLANLRAAVAPAEVRRDEHQRALERFRALGSSDDATLREAYAVVGPVVLPRAADAAGIAQARTNVAAARDIVQNGGGADMSSVEAALPSAQTALQAGTLELQEAEKLVRAMGAAAAGEESARADLATHADWVASRGTPERLVSAAESRRAALRGTVQRGDVATARTEAVALAATWAQVREAAGALELVAGARARWAERSERLLGLPNAPSVQPADVEQGADDPWSFADRGEYEAFANAQRSIAARLDGRTSAAAGLEQQEQRYASALASWDDAERTSRTESQITQVRAAQPEIAAARERRDAAWRTLFGNDHEAALAAPRELEAAAATIAQAVARLDLAPPALVAATPASGTFALALVPEVELSFDEPIVEAWLADQAMVTDGKVARLRPVVPGAFDGLDWRATDAAGNASSGRVAISAVPVKQVEWAEMIEAKPDPSVVTDAAARERMEQTELPWKVRDRQTGVVMLLVPPGVYRRGESPGDKTDRSDERPSHEVAIASAFYLAQFELTQGEWSRFGGQNEADSKGDDLPIVSFARNMIEAKVGAKGFRLPHDAEWEYACRAGTTSARYGELDEIAWHDRNSSKRIQPVGRKLANAWGFHDMLGNVGEWVATKHDERAFDRLPDNRPATVEDDRQMQGDYLARGGSIVNDASYHRASERTRFGSNPKSDSVGVRLARDP